MLTLNREGKNEGRSGAGLISPPRLTDLVKGEKLAIVNAWLQQYNFQRPFSLPPRTPNDRVNILRNSFAVIYGVIIVLVVIAGVRWLM